MPMLRDPQFCDPWDGDQAAEEREFRCPSDSEWDCAEALEIAGRYPPELQPAWICTDRDAWHKNPFYVGPPVPHPDALSDEDIKELNEFDSRLYPDPVEDIDYERQ